MFYQKKIELKKDLKVNNQKIVLLKTLKRSISHFSSMSLKNLLNILPQQTFCFLFSNLKKLFLFRLMLLGSFLCGCSFKTHSLLWTKEPSRRIGRENFCDSKQSFCHKTYINFTAAKISRMRYKFCGFLRVFCWREFN